VFIAIEGGEGAGKGSIQADLSARLTAQGLQVLPTREPGGTPEGLELRRLLLGSEGRVWDPWSELLLMTAARVQHVRRVILPAVERGDIVISDRFVGSTIAIARSLARLGQQDLDEGRFEAMSLEFHDRIRASFLQQAAARPGSHVVIDAGAPMAEVASRVFEAVSNWHGVQRQASSSFSEEKEPKRLL
jgi:dTMP kinase